MPRCQQSRLDNQELNVFPTVIADDTTYRIGQDPQKANLGPRQEGQLKTDESRTSSISYLRKGSSTMTIFLIANLLVLLANLGCLGMMIKLFTEWMKEKKYRER